LAVQEARRVVSFSEFKCILTVQSKFRRVYQKAIPDAKRIEAWQNKFLEAGSNRQLHVVEWGSKALDI
jgi:hypothetical protein